ncbi:polyprotein [Sweet potato mild mottle virus]|uniref:Genome polyprotein n=11 Tax=Sweet potato mild mottle virus TaxID=41459 RepID=POLG_SPMMV|nr:polyprotein [Sweet potato mild mottle virus]P89201.1 RecName: Full=Genome polyprotein; Contains: RecName: Full=P1 proteinase; AltName: Full=N-terminal protein; Contains: RecName: Full=Helper component proteinase; Short=HC-pro; Contains: RecName: Full=Protein P3; Contains: RecName: Full=6 kDa protein 1; Short=6K1; Contains: RecName: Full=Cytoplasmic inclusion protein; Short=CI; Contains: RecName: Full=6 kDa protein 2; Short=6K2; Contains: RecName: Full=Viral genome-linked protein; AltName: Full=
MGKSKLTYKQCIAKWGKAALEAQNNGSRRSVSVGTHQIAANIFAFYDAKDYHLFAMGKRGGLTPAAEQLRIAIARGTIYKVQYNCHFCPDCDVIVDSEEGWFCEDCGSQFNKRDDNVLDNKNDVARALGGWNEYEDATWALFEAARADMLEVAPTVGQLEKEIRAIEKSAGKKLTAYEEEMLEELAYKLDVAKMNEEKQEEVLEETNFSISNDEFPALNGPQDEEVNVVIEETTEESAIEVAKEAEKSVEFEIIHEKTDEPISDAVNARMVATPVVATSVTKSGTVIDGKELVEKPKTTMWVTKPKTTAAIPATSSKSAVWVAKPKPASAIFIAEPVVKPAVRACNDVMNIGAMVCPIMVSANAQVEDATKEEEPVIKYNITFGSFNYEVSTKGERIQAAVQLDEIIEGPDIEPILICQTGSSHKSETKKAAKGLFVQDKFSVIGNKVLCKSFPAFNNFMNETRLGGIYRTRKGNYKNAALRLLKATKVQVFYDGIKDIFECPYCHVSSNELEGLNGDNCEKCKDLFYKHIDDPRKVEEEYLMVPLVPIDQHVHEEHSIISKAKWEAHESICEGEVNIVKIFDGKPTASKKKFKTMQAPNVANIPLDDFMQELVEICLERNTPIEIIGGVKSFNVVKLRHATRDISKSGEDDMYPTEREWFCHKNKLCLCGGIEREKKVRSFEVRPGWSGVILHKNQVAECDWDKFVFIDDICVVQGRNLITNKIENALEKKGATRLKQIQFYASSVVPNFKDEFDRASRLKADHEPYESSNNELIGRLARLVAAVIPKGHLYCKTCCLRVIKSKRADIVNALSKAKQRGERDEFIYDELIKLFELQAPPPYKIATITSDDDMFAHIRIGWKPYSGRLSLIMQHLQGLHTSISMLHQSLAGAQNDQQIDRQALHNQVRILHQRNEEHMPFLKKAVDEIQLLNATDQVANARELYLDTRATSTGDFDILRKYQSIYEFFPNIMSRANKVGMAVIKSETSLSKAFALMDNAKSMNAIHTLIGEDVIDNTSGACLMKNDKTFFSIGCKQGVDGSKMYGPLCPTKQHVRIHRVESNMQIPLPTFHDATVWEFNEGYCYANQLAIMVGFINEDEMEFYKNQMNQIVLNLGAWPTFEQYLVELRAISLDYPKVRGCPAAIHLVSHANKLIHVLGQFGTINQGWHALEVATVGELVDLCHKKVEGEMLTYKVGGIYDWVTKKNAFIDLFEHHPENIFKICTSPSVLWLFARSCEKHDFINDIMARDHSLVGLFIKLEYVGKHLHIFQSVDDVCVEYAASMREIIEEHADIHGLRDSVVDRMVHAYHNEVREANKYELVDRILEKNIGLIAKEISSRKLITMYHRDLFSWHEWQRLKLMPHSSNAQKLFEEANERAYGKQSWNLRVIWGACKEVLYAATHGVYVRVKGTTVRCADAVVYGFYGRTRAMVSSWASEAWGAIFTSCLRALVVMVVTAYISTWIPKIRKMIKREKKQFEDLGDGELYVEQHGKKEEAFLFKICAIFALIAGIVDYEWGAAACATMNKVRSICTVLGSVGIESHANEPNDKVEQDLKESLKFTSFEIEVPTWFYHNDMTFERWFQHQIQYGNVCADPIYSGPLRMLAITESSAREVAMNIRTSGETDVRVYSGVGGGKSTRLPKELSMFGHVLICVPTRVLAESLLTSFMVLFNMDVNVAYRGRIHTGNAPITIMTYGYALNFLVHKPMELNRYDYVLLDEINTNPVEFAPLFSFIKTTDPKKKIVKLSATHAGMDCECETRHKIKVETLSEMPIESWVSMQGSGVVGDATSVGDVILVFVASFKDVDTCANGLRSKGFKVLKVDSRNFRRDADVDKQIQSLGEGKKFIVATNIIENGVTFNIDVVVDFGEKISPNLSSDERCITLGRQRISRAERIQRFGRAGRIKPGTVLRFGRGNLVDALPSVLTATESALLCFAHGIKPVCDRVDVAAIGTLTRQQALVSGQFELNKLLVAHSATPSGQIPRVVYELFKPLLLRTDAVPICSSYNAIAACNWLPLSTYMRRNEKNEHVLATKIPWYCSDLSEDFNIKLAECVKSCMSTSNARFIVDNVNFITVAHKISVGEKTVGQAKLMVGELLENSKSWRDGLLHVQSSSVTRSLVGLCTSWYQRRAKAALDRLDLQVNRLQLLYDQLGQVEITSDYDKLVEFFTENGECAAYLESQSKTDFLEKHVLELRQPAITKNVVGTAMFAVALTGCLFWWWMKRNEKYEFIEQHGKKIRLNRDKRNACFVFSGTDDAMVEEYGVEYSQDVIHGRMSKAQKARQMKLKGKKPGSDTRVKPFKVLYGIDPNDYDTVALSAGGLTTEAVPVGEASLIDLMLELDDETGIFRKQVVNELKLKYTNNANGEQAMVRLTPHDSRRATIGSFMPSGFPDHHGEWRQTGAAEIIKEKNVAVDSHVGTPTVDAEDKHIASRLAIVRTHKGETHGIFHGDKLITPFHTFKNACGNDTLTVQSLRGLYDYGILSRQKMEQVPKQDIMVLVNPIDVTPFKQSQIFRPPIQCEVAYMIVCRRTPNGLRFEKTQETEIFPLGKQYGGVWKHGCDTRLGDCGGPIIACRDRKIVGFNGGRLMQMKYNTVLAHIFEPVNETFIEMLAKMEYAKGFWKFNPELVEWSRLLPTTTSFPIQKQIQGVESHGKPGDKCCGGNLISVGFANVTRISKHVIKGKRPSFVEYCNTYPDNIFMRDNLCEHYGPSILSKAAFYKDFTKYDDPVKVGRLDCYAFDTALAMVHDTLSQLGFHGNSGSQWDIAEIFDDLNKKSSMGALYSGKKGQWMHGLTPEDAISLAVESYALLNSGHLGVWSGSLKAELRHVDKLKEGKTRVFTGAPIDTLLAGKILVDNFNNYFYKCHLQGPWTVGINKFNRGWNKLANYFNHDWVFIDCDGSRFDSSIPPIMFNAVCMLRSVFGDLDPDENQTLSNLYTEIVNTPILTIEGNIIRKFRGNNSGQPSTVVDNTLILMIAMEYAIAKVFVTRPDIKYVCNGDDLLINCPRSTANAISEHFKDVFADLSLNYDFDHVCDKITDVDFMSHSFMWLDTEQMYIPKLDKERIVAILEWERSDEQFRTRSALNAAYIESFGYEDLMTEIEKFAHFWAKKHGLNDVLMEREKVRSLYVDENFDASRFEKFYPESFSPFDVYVEPHASTSKTIEELQQEMEDLDSDTTITVVQRETQKAGIRDQIEALRAQQIVRPPEAQLQPDVTPAQIVTFEPPRVTGFGALWIPRQQRNYMTPSYIEKIKAYVPHSNLIESGLASEAQLTSWFENTCRDYQVSMDVFMSTILPAWIVNCIINGTSQERTNEHTWRAVIMANMEDQEVLYYPIKPIIINAQPTLRQVMRHFGEQAVAQYMNSLQVGKPFTVKGAVTAGYANVQDAWLGIDFLRDTMKLTTKQMEVKHQIIAANVTRRKIRVFALAAPGDGDELDTERHVVDDVARGRHSLRGAQLD